MALLFEPIQLGTLQLSNKVIIAPMCQYSANATAEVGFWHQQQWASYALSGAGLCIIEATAVQPNGRISDADLGLWNDHQAACMQAALAQIKSLSKMSFAIQLAHAGRKASTEKPWLGGKQIAPDTTRGWQTVSASTLPFHQDDIAPKALTVAEIKQLIADFAAAAQRAVAVGFDLIEIHAAHGYLLHQFLSPLANQRDDQYGGSFENRIRLILEVIHAIQAQVPVDFPIGIRISATDWMEGENAWDLAAAVKLCEKLDGLGLAYIHVSSGGLHPEQQIKIAPNYQVPFAAAIKHVIQTPVIAVGLITEAEQAEAILQQQQADGIAIGRSISFNPRWPWQAAIQLDAKIAVSPAIFTLCPTW